MSKATMRFETALDFLNGDDKDLESALSWLQKTFDVVESPEEVSEMAMQLASVSGVDPAFKAKFDSLAGKNQMAALEKMIEEGVYDKAEPILLEMAEAGDAEAMYLLGDLYEEKNDEENADKWLLLAYENGSTTAKEMAKSIFKMAEGNAEADDAHWASLYTLAGWLATGKMSHGWPCEKKVLKAVELYERVFAAGKLSVAIDIANLYADENSVIKDERKSFEWRLRAAEDGNADAQFSVGECYHFGYGVSKDFDQAVVWYAKAAKAGCAEAQCMLGTLYLGFENSGTVERDVITGLDWLRKAAAQENGDAEFIMGMVYARGIGVEKDLSKAKALAGKALEHGVNSELEESAKDLYKVLGGEV